MTGYEVDIVHVPSSPLPGWFVYLILNDEVITFTSKYTRRGALRWGRRKAKQHAAGTLRSDAEKRMDRDLKIFDTHERHDL